VDSGIYALCRHPGALWLPAFLLFFSLGIGSLGLVIAGILASFLNLLYVWFQDRTVFPRTIPGYSEYQLRVPFLLPTWQGVRSALTELLRRQE
jgi:protein-S-isoprenylcysteine O-methyltransferase Ste14